MSSPLGAETVFEDQRFEALDLRDGLLSGRDFVGCSFVECVFAGAKLESCGFEDCHFEGGELSMLQPHGTRFHGVRFEGCKLLGVDWRQASTFQIDVRFERCQLAYGIFSGLDLRGMKMHACQAREVDFSGARLSAADFCGSDLEGAMFVGADLTQADLSEARHSLLRPSQTKLRKTRLSLQAGLEILRELGVLVPGM